MIKLALFLLFLALLALWWASRQQRESGLPTGRVIYADTSKWGKVEMPFYHDLLKLTGKPDFLVLHEGMPVPVEVKSGWAPDQPYSGHLYQLAAYCLLVDKVHGKRPAYGILRYRNRTFALDYTPQLEAHLLDLLAEMRRDEQHKEIPRSHQDPARCARCGYRDLCNQKI